MADVEDVNRVVTEARDGRVENVQTIINNRDKLYMLIGELQRAPNRDAIRARNAHGRLFEQLDIVARRTDRVHVNQREQALQRLAQLRATYDTVTTTPALTETQPNPANNMPVTTNERPQDATQQQPQTQAQPEANEASIRASIETEAERPLFDAGLQAYAKAETDLRGLPAGDQSVVLRDIAARLNGIDARVIDKVIDALHLRSAGRQLEGNKDQFTQAIVTDHARFIITYNKNETPNRFSITPRPKEDSWPVQGLKMLGRNEWIAYVAGGVAALGAVALVKWKDSQHWLAKTFKYTTAAIVAGGAAFLGFFGISYFARKVVPAVEYVEEKVQPVLREVREQMAALQRAIDNLPSLEQQLVRAAQASYSDTERTLQALDAARSTVQLPVMQAQLNATYGVLSDEAKPLFIKWIRTTPVPPSNTPRVTAGNDDNFTQTVNGINGAQFNIIFDKSKTPAFLIQQKRVDTQTLPVVPPTVTPNPDTTLRPGAVPVPQPNPMGMQPQMPRPDPQAQPPTPVLPPPPTTVPPVTPDPLNGPALPRRP